MTRTMHKICIIADAIDTQYAGVFTYASMLIPALEATKPPHVELTYLHTRPHGFFKGKREYILPNARRFPGSDTVRRMVTIPRFLRKEGFDLVHDLGHMAPFPRRHEHYAKVVTVHDLTPLTMPAMHVRTSRLTHRHLFPKIIQRCDHVITVSETTKRDVMQLLAPSCPVTAIPLASKVLHYAGERPYDAPYILFVSTLEPRKNLEQLLAAFELLKKAGLPHHLVLIGKEGWHITSLLERLDASPWRSSIHRPGFVPEDALGAWYAHADVAVYPSLYEGFGLPILEAQAAGTPLVVTDTPASREVAGDAAIIVPLHDAQALATALEQLLKDREKWRHLSATGRAHANTFSWEKTAQATWKVYMDAIARRDVAR